jgi:hypothetical protein
MSPPIKKSIKLKGFLVLTVAWYFTFCCMARKLRVCAKMNPDFAGGSWAGGREVQPDFGESGAGREVTCRWSPGCRAFFGPKARKWGWFIAKPIPAEMEVVVKPYNRDLGLHSIHYE